MAGCHPSSARRVTELLRRIIPSAHYWLFSFVLLLCATASTNAQITITLPRGNWYQPGQYLSVTITGAASTSQLRLEADGALPTIIDHPAPLLTTQLLVVDAHLSNLHIIQGDSVTPYPQPLRPDTTSHATTAPGPAGALTSEYAYHPIFGWKPVWPSAVRWNILALTISLAALLIAASLIPHRQLALSLIIVLIAAATILAAFLPSIYPPIASAQGAVLATLDNDRWQLDRWSFQTSRRTQSAALIWQDQTYPIFFSRQHRQALNMQLLARSDGQPLAFTYHLPASGSVVFFTRTTLSPTAIPLTQPLSSLSPTPRLRDLIWNLYHQPITATFDQPAGDRQQWLGGNQIGRLEP
ncbi:MAG: hypothetical protein IT448_06985 [Phycisphaerales bacterium]|nr:hypothetical protein [Phycisphaerales bacterium]